MPESVILDTSVLIALSKINSISLLCKLYHKVFLPTGVMKEFGDIKLECIEEVKVDSPLVRLLIDDLNLGKGESEAIALAFKMKSRIIIDEIKARRIAEDLGLAVSGTIGILLKAQSRGYIKNAYKKVTELRDKGFYVSDELLKKISKFNR